MYKNNELATWRDVWSPISEIRREMDRLFDDWATPDVRKGMTESALIPACEVEESEDHFLLTLEMPGMRKEDLKLEISDGRLVITGERHQPPKKAEENRWYTERRFGKFQRNFSIPPTVDTNRVEANYQDGILSIVIPKAESSKSRQIKIGSGPSGFFAKLLGQSKNRIDANTESHDTGESFSPEYRAEVRKDKLAS